MGASLASTPSDSYMSGVMSQKRLLNLLVITLFWGAAYGSFYLLTTVLPRLSFLMDPVFGLIWAFYLLSIVYSRSWFKAVLKRKAGPVIVVSGILMAASAGVYIHHFFRWSWKFYTLYSEPSPSFIGRLRKADPEYGYQHRAYARACYIIPPADSIPVYTDGYGFRVTRADIQRSIDTGRMDILFLGCSFTYGEYCKADSTFSHLSAQALGFRYLNAGVSGWGLSQMHLKAQELIPKYKPRYVVLQYSYWLPQRAAGMYRYSADYPMPKPYYEVLPSGRFGLATPPFASRAFEVDTDSVVALYREHPLQFFKYSRIPALLLEEDLKRLGVGVQRIMGRYHPITEDLTVMKALSRQVYAALMELCRQNGAQPIILHLSKQHTNFDEYPGFLSSTDTAAYIDGMKYHKQHLAHTPGASFKWDFIHWRARNGDTVTIDTHPNHFSHYLISKSIVERIKAMEVDTH